MKRAFTMIEFIFVIVILGILSAVAVPRIFATREDALIVKAKNQIANIQSAVANMYAINMMSGNFDYPLLDGDDGKLFGNVLQISVLEKGNEDVYGWNKIGNDGKYKFTLGKKSTVFTYDKSKGLFFCETKDELCAMLTK